MINKYNIGQDIIVESTTSPYGIRAGKVVAFIKDERTYIREGKVRSSFEIRYEILLYPLYQDGEKIDDDTMIVNNIYESFIYEKFDDAVHVIKKQFINSHNLPNTNIFE